MEITCVGTAEAVFCQCIEIWSAPVVRHTHTSTAHTPDENQLTAWPASSDVPTPVPFINVQPKAAGLGPTASPTRLNSTPTKQTQRDRERDVQAKRKTVKQSKAQNIDYLIEYVDAAGKTRARERSTRAINQKTSRKIGERSHSLGFGGQLGILDWRPPV